MSLCVPMQLGKEVIKVNCFIRFHNIRVRVAFKMLAIA